MGEASDDMFDAAMADGDRQDLMKRHGVVCCSCSIGNVAEDEYGNCKRCGGLGYIDRDGNPFDF